MIAHSVNRKQRNEAVADKWDVAREIHCRYDTVPGDRLTGFALDVVRGAIFVFHKFFHSLHRQKQHVQSHSLDEQM